MGLASLGRGMVAKLAAGWRAVAGDPEDDTPVAVTRRRLAVLIAGAVVLSAVATVLATMLIRSPAEEAARAAAPEQTPLLAPAEMRRIETKVVTRGTGKYGSARDFVLVKSPLKAGPRTVTGLPEPGAVFTEGQVVTTISGRPVFLFQGATPSYRDLGPGVRGPDVLQLEQALSRLGFDPGAVDDSYDLMTGRAVLELFRRAGYPPLIASRLELRTTEPIETNLVLDGYSTGGPQMASDEMFFVPTLPLRVSDIKARIGSEPTEALFTATGSAVVLDGALTLDESRLVKPGMQVRIDEPTLGINTTGTVTEVADRPGTKGADSFHVYLAASVDNPPASLVGASVRMSIPVSVTQGDVLAVPVGAVYLEPDGSSAVRRSRDANPQGSGDVVRVQPGVSSDGFVAVTPTGGELKPGDLVMVGTGKR